MKPDNSLRLLNLSIGLVIVTGIAVLAWMWVEPLMISPQAQLPLKDLARQHWEYRNNIGSYLNWRWPPMIAVGYPYAFTLSVLCGVLGFGAVLSLFRWHWLPLAPALGNLRPLARVRGQSFSIRRWVREGKGCLWMPYQAKQIPALRGLISCWMGLAISETLSLPASDTRRIWFHVDELDALGRINGLKDALARLRKVGGCVVLGLQSIAQARAVYGEAEANTIIENCHNKLILNCGASERGGTAQFASDVIGDREVEREDVTTSRGAGPNGTTNTSRAVRRQREPAVMDSEIMQLDPCVGYLKLASRKEWLAVAFQPIDFEERTEPYVRAAQVTES